MERARVLQPNLARLGIDNDNKRPKRVLGGHPPTRTAAHNLLKVANGLVSVRCSRLGARPWQRESYDRAHGWQAKLAERTQLFSRFTRSESTVAAMCVSNPDCSPVGINR
jgi:hypothetical protein